MPHPLSYRWLVGNSLASFEAARGTSEEENAKAMLRALLEREVGGYLYGAW